MGLLDFFKRRPSPGGEEGDDPDPAFSRELDDLINQLRNLASAQSRGFTAERIGARGSKAARAIPHLLYVLQNDPGADARTGAAGALGDVGIASQEVVDALVRAVRHDVDDVRLNAIISLGQLGPTADVALPLLESIAASPSESSEIRFRAGISAKILKQESGLR